MIKIGVDDKVGTGLWMGSWRFMDGARDIAVIHMYRGERYSSFLKWEGGWG